MNGIQAITAQIIADAQTEADRILAQARARAKECLSAYQEQAYIQTVSYTHLTLPTILLV